MKKQHPIPFDETLSRKLDQATADSESRKPIKRWRGKRQKRKIERRIWGR